MGCDGGTIPKRNEIVKTKQKDQTKDKNAELSAKWQFCALSGLKLKAPIVACPLGRLYNKDAIIEHLLNSRGQKQNNQTKGPTVSKTSPGESQTIVSHIRTLKDVKELNLTRKLDYNDKAAESGNEAFEAEYICPITSLEMNGNHKFVFLYSCGCVISARALKQVPNKVCLVCSKPFSQELDVVLLNGDPDELNEMKVKMIKRRQEFKRSKTNGESSGCNIKKLKSSTDETTIVKPSTSPCH